LAVVRHSTQRIVVVLHCRVRPVVHMAAVVQVATHVFVVVSQAEFIGQLPSPTHATHVPAAEQ
jgi:hypothetical protein